MEIQERINQLDKHLSATVTNPEWFADPVATRAWIEEEIAEIEADQLAEIGRSRFEGKLIVPNVPQWLA